MCEGRVNLQSMQASEASEAIKASEVPAPAIKASEVPAPAIKAPAKRKRPPAKKKAPPAEGCEPAAKRPALAETVSNQKALAQLTEKCKAPCEPTHKRDGVSAALSSVAADAYLQVEPEVGRLMRGVEIRPRVKGSPEHYATWRPRGSVFFTLIKVRGNTVAFCHANGLPYYAAPAARLAEGCPVGTALLCQYCLDHGHTPRLLVFDVLEECADVKARGQHLRDLAKYLPQPLCAVQWAGQVDALEGFTARLPHPVECVVGLGEDPLLLQRYMRIALPQGMPGAAAFEGFLVH